MELVSLPHRDHVRVNICKVVDCIWILAEQHHCCHILFVKFNHEGMVMVAVTGLHLSKERVQRFRYHNEMESRKARLGDRSGYDELYNW